MKGKPGRPSQPKTIPDPALVYGQVVKEREGHKVVRVAKRLVMGPPATELAHISTSLLERQNGTARSRNRYLVRKTYAFAKKVEYMDDQLRWIRPSTTSAGGIVDSKARRLR